VHNPGHKPVHKPGHNPGHKPVHKPGHNSGHMPGHKPGHKAYAELNFNSPTLGQYCIVNILF
jgi:hypothetical protein